MQLEIATLEASRANRAADERVGGVVASAEWGSDMEDNLKTPT
jgi:hypothetical protein